MPFCVKASGEGSMEVQSPAVIAASMLWKICRACFVGYCAIVHDSHGCDTFWHFEAGQCSHEKRNSQFREWSDAAVLHALAVPSSAKHKRDEITSGDRRIRDYGGNLDRKSVV